MKDQINHVDGSAEAFSDEIEKLKRKRQDVFVTVAHIEGILGDPVVSAAIHNLEPFSTSPSVVPERAEEPEPAGAP
jgi:hypothetical protein